MKIAVLGAGQVGGAIGGAWSKLCHDVRFGVPDPTSNKYANLLNLTRPAEAARDAEVVVLATPWGVVEQALKDAGDLGGKVLIDATNPLNWSKDAGLSLAMGFTDSGGEAVQRWAPGARVVKSLNQTGFENMGAAARYPARPVMYLAGDDAGAKEIVSRLVADLGFDPVDAGALQSARLLEPLAMLWIHQAINLQRGRNFAIGVLRADTKEGPSA